MSDDNVRFVLSNRAYDYTKRLVQVILPAVSSAYFTLAAIYGWDNADKVVGTIAVITTFLGVTLGISTVQYNKSDAPYDGTINVTENDEGTRVFSMELDVDPDQIPESRNFNLRVRTPEE